MNLTTTSPAQARELAAWSAAVGAEYLDGGILAVPSMIGHAGASILYSGSDSAFQRCRPLLDAWATSTYLGPDPGLPSLYDMALLAGTYVMFAGFLHGAAAVAPAGVTAGDFAGMSVPWDRLERLACRAGTPEPRRRVERHEHRGARRPRP